MNCGEVMRVTTTSLYSDAPISEAIEFMVEKHMGLVPVVDRNGVFVGELSGDRLMHAMLPHSLMMMRGVKRASFLNESREELKERLEELANKPISTIMNIHEKIVYPDTPLSDAMFILSENQNVVPVVEKETGKMLGAISFFSVLRAVEGGE